MDKKLHQSSQSRPIHSMLENLKYLSDMASMEETVRPTFANLSKTTKSMLTYGLPFHQACERHIRETFKAERAYIIASKTLSEKTPFLSQLQEALGSRVVGTWIGIPPHTPADALLPIIQDARQKEADCLITLGGGSISDGAKLISLALPNNVSTTEGLLELPRLSGKLTVDFDAHVEAPKIPVVCIPISLSGGEYSRFAGVTDGATNFKYQFTHKDLYPSLLVLDPEVTTSTPMPLWLSSGVRSIDHCVEGFLSANATEEGDAVAVKGLVQLVNGLLQTHRDADDLDARLRCQLGSNLSMTLLFLEIAKGASHGIGHQLGPMGVGHGDTSCILLPAVCKYNAEVNREKQERLKQILLDQTLAGQFVDNNKGGDLGDVLRTIFNTLGMPRTLRDVGIRGDQLDELAHNCLDEVYVQTNPRPLTKISEVVAILESVKD